MACADPGIFSGGWGEGGGPSPTAWKHLDNVLLLFFSLQLILQFTEGVHCFFTEKTILFHWSRGVQHFPGGGVNFFQGGGGGLQMLISIETHIFCDFPGGVQTPYPPSPLDPHMYGDTNRLRYSFLIHCMLNNEFYCLFSIRLIY